MVHHEYNLTTGPLRHRAGWHHGLGQLFELFTLEGVDDRLRAGFVRVLSALARSGPVWVICTMRSDFYHRLAELPELVALAEGAGQFHFLPPSPVEIAQMIRNPARAAGESAIGATTWIQPSRESILRPTPP